MWLAEGTQEPEEEEEVILQDWQLLLLTLGAWHWETESLLGVNKRKTKLSG